MRNRTLYAPLHKQPNEIFYRRLGGHTLLVFLCVFLVVFSSLMIGAMLGDVASVPIPQLGLYAITTGLSHFWALYVAFNIKSWKWNDVRLNPYISFIQCFLHERIGIVVWALETLAQALATACAGLLIYGILKDSPEFLAGVGGGPIIHTSIGGAFGLEVLGGFFVGFVYLHDWHGKKTNTSRLPTMMAYILAGTIMLSYPFIGTTTHNPFRWLAACTIEGSCGITGSWIYPVGPFVGIILSYFVHLFTLDA